MKGNRPIELRVRASRDSVTGDARLEASEGWKIAPASRSFHLGKAGDVAELEFQVTPPPAQSRVRLRAEATVDGAKISVARDVIEYSHIPVLSVLRPPDATLTRATVESMVKRIGYVQGAGDRMPESLRAIGFDVTLIAPGALPGMNLANFDAVVLGIRAWNVAPELEGARGRLLEYMREGGVVIAQYAITGRDKPVFPLAPYDLTIGRDRISVEEAPLMPIVPGHALLEWPNRIAAADFDGWVQERGLYFAEKWDARFQPLLRGGDPGEPPVDGALLYAPYGKGAFLYTGLSFFRQLPAGVPGAYRLFVNLLNASQPRPSRR